MNDPFDLHWSELEARTSGGRGTPGRQIEAANLPRHLAEPLQKRDSPPVVWWTEESGRQRFLLSIRPDESCFAGHFPGNPILPGVVQLHWAILLARYTLGFSEPPRDILRLKFQRIVVPPAVVELRLEPKTDNRVEFRVLGREDSHSRGLLVFPGRAE
jgi:hypothetical protein